MSTYIENKFGSCFNAFAQTDVYYSQVSLYYNGKKRIVSKIGLLMTWIVIILMLCYSISRGVVLLQGTKFQTQMATILKPQNYSDTQIQQMNEYGFDIAFQIMDDYPKEYGEFSFNHYQHTWVDGNFSTIKRVRTNIELEPCTEDNFNHTDKEEIRAKGMLQNYRCVKNKTLLAMGGSYRSDLFQQLEIQVFPCVNSSSLNYTCKSEEEIAKFFQDITLSIIVSNYYFDKNDANEPIKSYLDDSIFFPINTDLQQMSQLFLQIAQVKYYDSMMPWVPAKIQNLTLLERVSANRIGSNEYQKPRLLSIQIREDLWSNHYYKEVFSLTEYFSEVGGIFNSIYSFGKLIAFLFTDSLLMLKLISSYYLTRDHQKLNLEPHQSMQISQEVCNEVVIRRPFSISKCDFLKSYLPFQCFRTNQEQLNNHQMFKRGKAKIRQELDIVQLLQMMREFRIIKKLLFTKAEHILIGASRSQVLDADKSDNDDSPPDKTQSFKSDDPFSKAKTMYQKIEILEKALQKCEKSSISKNLISGILEKQMKYRKQTQFAAKENQLQKKQPYSKSQKVQNGRRQKVQNKGCSERRLQQNLQSPIKDYQTYSKLDENESCRELQDHSLSVKYKKKERKFKKQTN